jgi:hypothetical protein
VGRGGKKEQEEEGGGGEGVATHLLLDVVFQTSRWENKSCVTRVDTGLLDVLGHGVAHQLSFACNRVEINLAGTL